MLEKAQEYFKFLENHGVSEYAPPEDNMLAESENVYVVGDLFHG